MTEQIINILIKKCSGECQRELPEIKEYFYLRSDTGKFRNECKKCYYKQRAERLKNNVVRKEQDKKYRYNLRRTTKYLNNKKEYDKWYNSQQKNKNRKNKWNREKRKNDISYKLKRHFAREVLRFLKNNKISKNTSTWKILPYTPEQLKQHIENQFDENMSWENHGKYWHIDHIIPQNSFEISSITDPKLQECWALENLRPLKAFDNLSKGAKIINNE